MKKFLLVVCALMSLNILTAQKNVLVEEATGTWCGYCPAGIYYLDSLHNTYDNVISISVHLQDPMSNDEYHAGTGFTSAPSANIGRHFEDKEYQEWFECVQTEMEIPAKTTVAVENQFDEATRVLTSTVTVTAIESFSGSYRLSAIICEDAVTGPAPQYNQVNNYSNVYISMGGWEFLPNPVPAHRMAYDHVGRQLLGGYNGEGMNYSMAQGETYTRTFTYTLPENYDEDYIRVVGVVVDPSGSVDNAGISSYLDGSDNAAPKFTSTPSTETFALVNYIYNIYVHDTDDKELTISVEEKPEWLTFEQYDNKSAAIYGSTSTPGEYEVVLKVSDGETETLQSYTIVVSEPLDETWTYLGQRSFTQGDSFMYILGSCTYNGYVYVLVKEYGMPVVYKYDPQTDEWTGLISTMDMMEYDGSIAVDSQGVIYIAYSLMGNQQVTTDDMVKVKKFENNQWVDYGNIGRTGGLAMLHIDSNDVVYLGFKDYSENNRFFVYKYVNNDWQRISSDVSSGTWAKMTVDGNGTPYVSWADTYAGNYLYVSKNVGEMWLHVGGGPVSEDVRVYLYQDLAVAPNGDLYVAFSTNTDNSLAAFRYNGTEWESLGENISSGPAKGIDVSFDEDGKFYVAYSDVNSDNSISVMKFDGEGWSYVGQRAFTELSNQYFSMTMLYNSPCVVFTDVLQGSQASAMYYKSNVFLTPPAALEAEIVNEDDALVSWQAPGDMTPISYNIYRNDVKVGNTTELSYTDEGLAQGVYRYTVTAVYEEGESPAAGPVSVEVTVSIIENNVVAFEIYPNPAENYIIIESVKDAEVKIFSINGQMISQHNISEGINNIDMSDLSAGMYFVNVNGTMIKVVKK